MVSSKWIRGLFIGAVAPSIAMIIALLWYPESDIARCPLFQQDSLLAKATQALPNQYILRIDESVFPINNLTVVPLPVAKGEYLVFLGIVLDVRSGSMFYGQEGGYSALANGKDSTRALLLSSLKEEDMREDIGPETVDDQLIGKLKQWLSFFLNKYPQKGVVEGMYWTAEGKAKQEFLKLVSPLSGGSHEREDPVMSPRIEKCLHVHDNQVKCMNGKLIPKIQRTRGFSRCVCVDGNEIFGVKTNDFVIVHFQNCTSQERICTIMDFELQQQLG
jgi:hypothetical protein